MVNRSQRHLVSRQGYSSGSISGAPGTINAFNAAGGIGKATYNITPGPGCFQVGVYWVPAGDTLDKGKHVRHGVPVAPLTPMTFVDGDPNVVNLLPNGDFGAVAAFPVLGPQFSIGAGVLTKAGTPKYAMTTLDGVTGTYVATPYHTDNASYFDLGYSPSLNRVVAVSNTGDLSVQVMTSDDAGASWTARAVPEDQDLNGVAWSPSLAKFVAVGAVGANRGLISSDGITWTPIVNANLAALAYRGVAWSPTLNLFAAAAVTGSSTAVATSPDGLTWTRRNSAGHGGWTGIIWAGAPLNMFVMICNVLGNQYRIATSTDGVTWTGRPTPNDATFQPRTIAYSPDLNRLVALGNVNTTMCMTSTDGINWTEVVMPDATSYAGAAWGGGRFIVGNTAASGQASIYTSPDGLVWTPQPGIRRQGYRSALYVSSAGKFVVVASGSNTGMQTYDAAKWTGLTLKEGDVLRFGLKVASVVGTPAIFFTITRPDFSTNTTLLQLSAVGDAMGRLVAGPLTGAGTEARISASDIFAFSVDDALLFKENGLSAIAPQGMWDLYPFPSTIGGLEGPGFAPVMGVRVY